MTSSTSTPQDELEGLGPRIRELLTGGDAATAGELVGSLHPSDVADLLEELEESLRIRLLSVLPVELASEALAEMEEDEHPEEVLAAWFALRQQRHMRHQTHVGLVARP